MVEISTSILSVKKGEESQTFLCVRKGTHRLFSHRCYGWKICRKRHI